MGRAMTRGVFFRHVSIPNTLVARHRIRVRGGRQFPMVDGPPDGSIVALVPDRFAVDLDGSEFISNSPNGYKKDSY